MKPIKDFEDYIEEGIITKKQPDISRSNSCLKEAKKTEEFIEEIIYTIRIHDKNANSVIKLLYDVIMEKIRSKMILEGYSASGQGAHEAEVSYLKQLHFSEQEVAFCDQLRYFRNGILYYGKEFDVEYAQKVLEFLKEFNKKIPPPNGGNS
jgi:hypothetical protein